MFCLFFVLLLQSFFSRSVTALTVESNSPCHSTCGGGTTPGGALNCQDGGYNTTDKGRQMEACLECESTSTVANPSNGNDTGKTDLYWFIFNMKYTLEFCLFQQDTPDNSSVPACFSLCNPLAPILLDGWFTPPAYRPLYEYCSSHDNVFLNNAEQCTSCLKRQPGSVILGNFLDAMRTACDSKPNATNGQTLQLPQPGLFSLDTSPATPTAPTTTNTTTPSSSPSSTSHTSSGLSAGASAGIGVGVGVGALLVLAGLGFWCFRRRQQRRQHQYSQPPPPPKDFYDREQATGDPYATQTWERKELPAEDLPRHREDTNKFRGANSSDPDPDPDQGTLMAEYGTGTGTGTGTYYSRAQGKRPMTAEETDHDGRGSRGEGGSVSAELEVPRTPTPVAELDGDQRARELRQERRGGEGG